MTGVESSMVLIRQTAELVALLITLVSERVIEAKFDTTTPVRLMTYNLRFDNPKDAENAWPNRKQMVADQINSLKPDVFGTQEALYHQLHSLDSALTHFVYVGGGRDDGKNAGEFSAVFYNTDVFDKVNDETFWLSETPEVPSRGWDAMLNRVCTSVHLIHKKSKKELWVFNVHFDHVGEKARAESARLILERTEKLRKSGAFVVFMGDLNLEPESETLRSISKDMRDSFSVYDDKKSKPTGTFNAFDTKTPATKRIDYVFLNPGRFELVRYRVPVLKKNGRFPSDHFPVVVDVKMK